MQYEDEVSGGLCLALIAFLFCLEIYQAEQQRKRKLH